MDDKYDVNLNDYSTVEVTCPDCGQKYSRRLHRDHVAQKRNGELMVHCPDCAKAKRVGVDNFEIKAKE